MTLLRIGGLRQGCPGGPRWGKVRKTQQRLWGTGDGAWGCGWSGQRHASPALPEHVNSQSSRKSGETEKEGEEGREKGGRGSEGERQGERRLLFQKMFYCFKTVWARWDTPPGQLASSSLTEPVNTAVKLSTLFLCPSRTALCSGIFCSDGNVCHPAW